MIREYKNLDYYAYFKILPVVSEDKTFYRIYSIQCQSCYSQDRNYLKYTQEYELVYNIGRNQVALEFISLVSAKEFVHSEIRKLEKEWNDSFGFEEVRKTKFYSDVEILNPFEVKYIPSVVHIHLVDSDQCYIVLSKFDILEKGTKTFIGYDCNGIRPEYFIFDPEKDLHDLDLEIVKNITNAKNKARKITISEGIKFIISEPPY